MKTEFELLKINALWLNQVAARMELAPVALLNGILTLLRTRDGIGPKGSLEDWLVAAGTPDQMPEDLLVELRDTRVLVEEAARGTQRYISRIEAERNPLGRRPESAPPDTSEATTTTPSS